MENRPKLLILLKIVCCLAITTNFKESSRNPTTQSMKRDEGQFSTSMQLGEFSFAKGVYVNPVGKYDHTAGFPRDISTTIDSNPLLAALLLSSFLNLSPKSSGSNHPQHLSPNPYVALLLSQFGKYLPSGNFAKSRNIYAYSAANNYHNNKPFGAYKIYEDKDL